MSVYLLVIQFNLNHTINKNSVQCNDSNNINYNNYVAPQLIEVTSSHCIGGCRWLILKFGHHEYSPVAIRLSNTSITVKVQTSKILMHVKDRIFRIPGNPKSSPRCDTWSERIFLIRHFLLRSTCNITININFRNCG